MAYLRIKYPAWPDAEWVGCDLRLGGLLEQRELTL
jgi:hypothetical protein